MKTYINKGLRLNAVTGPKVHKPALSPDTLKGFSHNYYGFTQIYEIESNTQTLHYELANIGMQYTIPNSILLPPQVTECLGLNNDDVIILRPSELSEARIVHYRLIDPTIQNLPVLQQGLELNKIYRFNLNGQPIELLSWEPEGCFYGPNTVLVESDEAPEYTFKPENIADEVVTGLEDQTHQTIKEEYHERKNEDESI